MYKTSTGQKPYQEKSDDKIAALFRSRTYPNHQELSPPGLGDIIRSCWSERYVVAEQVVLSSSPVATTLVPLGQVAVNDLIPLNLCALYLSLHPEERLATLMPRGQGPKAGGQCILIEGSML